MPKKILLADDSITIQKVVELTFSDGDYEVTAVNNGAKALQKLAEMRPDIILSDIIMPEKNGYEVCEYVKSHAELRGIPVVLLTGTFEPFDPDRAEKAGCDAVVTKPFESQSLIHKVEELIAQAAQSHAAPAPAATPEPPASPWMEEPAAAPESPSPFTTSGGSFPTPPVAFTHDADIFGAAPAPEATTEMPFETSSSPFGAPPPEEAFSSETRAFTKMSVDDLQKLAAESAPPPPAPISETSPWDEPAEMSGETRAFTKVAFADFAPPAPEPEPAPESESPFGAPPPAEEFSSETRAFTKMSFDDLRQMASAASSFAVPEPEPAAPAAAPEPVAESSPWDEPFAGETRAFPKMSFDDLQQMAGGAEPAAPAPAEPSAPAEPWGATEAPWAATAEPWAATEEPAPGGETRAFPSMSFDERQQPAGASSVEEPPAAAPWDEPASSWPAEEPAAEAQSFTTSAVPFVQPEQVSTAAAAAVPEDLPFASPVSEEAEPPAEALWSAPVAAANAAAESVEPPAPSSAKAPEAAPALPIARDLTGDLTDEQIDRIARRVVELMSDQVVRNIAWEVIPDLAEMVVKERIRQLESEA